MMKKSLVMLLVLSFMAVSFVGCGTAVGGPRFYWDDQQQKRLDDSYRLPAVDADEDEAQDKVAKPKAKEKKDAERKSAAGAIPRAKD